MVEYLIRKQGSFLFEGLSIVRLLDNTVIDAKFCADLLSQLVHDVQFGLSLLPEDLPHEFFVLLVVLQERVEVIFDVKVKICLSLFQLDQRLFI